MQKTITLLCFLISFTIFSQNRKPPIYKNCETLAFSEVETCFFNNLKNDFLADFKLPEDVKESNYKGKIIILFSISTAGTYTINYINSNYLSIKSEIERVFLELPKVKPAMYNGRTIESDFVLPFYIPLEDNYKKEPITVSNITTTNLVTEIKPKEVNFKNYPEINSGLSIPFTHQEYAIIHPFYSQEKNEHSAVKPYFYNEVSNYSHLASYKLKLHKNVNTKLGEKLWNKIFFTVKGKNYWFSINPIFDLQLGKDNSDIDYTYNNTRALNIKGTIGKIAFSTSYYESQGRFANYLNDYMRYLKPENSHAIMLGRGRAKNFKNGGFDYPVAEAYISYAPNKHFNLQFGNGKNFIGDGYRSLFLSDVAAPYTFAKISTTFWKIKYTNLWMWLDDVRPGSFENGSNLRKYTASHHLSINLTDKLNIGLFESTITNERSNSNIDINFLNPIIFYRAVEFSRGSRSGNAIVGINAKYKLNNIHFYGQFVLDEIIVGELFKNNGFWANKFGYQLGFNYNNAFRIKNLFLQAETNVVRPFTYSHRDSELNYTHFYQPLAHPWGSNFVEFVGIARYNKNRWFGNLKLVAGKKGFNFKNDETNYGGDIFLSYNSTQNTLYNNHYYQGNTANIFIADLQVGYTINPTTNLQLFGNISLRNFDVKQTVPYFLQKNTTWFSFGIKTSMFNSYFDL